MVRPTDHLEHPIVNIVSTATPPPTETPEAVVRRYFASFRTGDAETIAANVSEDFVNEHTAGLGTGCETRAVYQTRLASFLADMVGLVYEIEHLVSNPKANASTDVAVFYTMRASWQGAAPFSIRGAQRLIVADGLITHRTDYWDSAVFLTQVDDDARAALAKMGIG